MTTTRKVVQKEWKATDKNVRPIVHQWGRKSISQLSEKKVVHDNSIERLGLVHHSYSLPKGKPETWFSLRPGQSVTEPVSSPVRR